MLAAVSTTVLVLPALHLARPGLGDLGTEERCGLCTQSSLIGFGIMLGYLSWDSAVLIYHRTTISMFWEVMAHHFVGLLAVLSVVTIGGPHIYVAWAAAQEVSNPFLHMLWWMQRTPGARSTHLYTLNGIGLAMSFGLVRVLPQPWMLWCFFTDISYINHRYSQFWPLKEVMEYSTLILVGLLFNFVLQGYWYVLIVHGFLKHMRGGSDGDQVPLEKD